MAFEKPAATPIVIASVFPALAIIAVVGRIWARRAKRIPYKVDDWMVIAALVVCVGNAITLIVAATHGELGKKQPLDPDGNPYPNPSLETFQKSIYVNEITSQVAITVSRAAVLLLFHRIFFAQTTYFPFISWTLQAINAAWGVSFLFVYIFQCWPIEQVWSETFGTRKHCVESGEGLWYAIAITGVIIDAAVLVLPWPYVFRLRLPKREKWGVIGIFMLGFLALGAAIGKTVNFYRVGSLIEKDHQITYNESTLMYWSVPETCLAVVCACLPTLRGVLTELSLSTILQSMRSSLASRSGHSSQGPQKSNGSTRSSHSGSSDSRPFNSREISFETTPWKCGPDAEKGHVGTAL